MTTARDLCTLALKLSGAIGVGQTAGAEDINDAFTLMNAMLGQWSQKRWLVYHDQDVPFRATGAASYSIGEGATIDVPRPDRIESAFARYSSGTRTVDYPLDVIEAREDWNLVPMKNVPGLPSAIFYDSGYPTGTVFISPVPAATYEIHLSLKQALAEFANLSDALVLPAQYREAILYNLAGRLRPMYQLPPDPTVVALARAALNGVRMSNVQVPRLTMPDTLPLNTRPSIGSAAVAPAVGSILGGQFVLGSG